MIRTLAVVVILALASAAAHAGPMGPIKPKYGRLSVEFEASSDRREMELSTNRQDRSRSENVNYLGRLAYGLTDKVEVSARLGGANLDVVDLADAGNQAEQTLNGNNQFSWGLGLSGIIYSPGRWFIGGTANYLAHRDHNGTLEPPAATGFDVNYAEWNLGLQVQATFDRWQPYVGVKYSDARNEYDQWAGVAMTGRDGSDQHVGLYLGAGLDITPQWSGYLEGRFIEETAFGGGIRFTY